MAIQTKVEKKDVILEFDLGMVDGKQALRKKTYNVALTATNEKMKAFADAIGTVSAKSVLGVYARDLTKLIEI